MGLREREGELAELNGLFDQARGGSGAVALVHGEAGIGKTSLVRVFVDDHLDDAFILSGGCDDLLTPRPFSPVWDMAFDEPFLYGVLEKNDRPGVFRSVLDLFTRSLRPTIAVFEDVHWGDDATLDLITFLGRRIGQTHTLLILTFRDDMAAMERLAIPLGALPHDRLNHLPLAPLSVDAVAALAGQDLDGSSIWEVSRGNPFFVTELISSGGWGIPVSVSDATRARVNRLSDVGRALVELVAVVPGRIEMSVVDKVDPGLRVGLADAEGVGMLKVVGRVISFRHELVRQAVEVDLSGARRTELNLAVLEALEMTGSDVSRLAHHAREAGDEEAILRILPIAARSAASAGSHHQAMLLLRALSPFAERMSLEERADYYDLLAEEEHMTVGGGVEAIRRSIDMRRSLDDPKRLGWSLQLGAFLAQLDNDRRTAAQWIDEAIPMLEPVGGDHLAMVYAQAARLAMSFSAERARSYCDLALAHGNEISASRASALDTLGAIKAARSYPDGLDLLEESHRIAEESGDVIESSRAAITITISALMWRDIPTAEKWISWAKERAEAIEVGTLDLYVRVLHAELQALMCNWEEAETEANSVSENSRTLANARTSALILLAQVRTRSGRRGVVSDLRHAWESAKETGEPPHILRAGAVLAEHRWLGGTVDREMVDELMTEFGQIEGGNDPWLEGQLAVWLWLCGDIPSIPDHAQEVLRELVSGQWEEAAHWFEGRGDRYYEALALSLGDDDARLRALKILEDVVAHSFATKLRAELKAEGISVPPRRSVAARQSPFGLTPRQTEVLKLLREGLSNAQIGERLVISERTVEHHVSAILTRLEVASRREAVEKAQII